jgi:hypothetical protein
VQVLECKDLVGADRNGLSDPYVKLRLQQARPAGRPEEEEKRTEKQKETTHPRWADEKFCFSIDAGAVGGREVQLLVVVMDWNRGVPDVMLGQTTIELGDAFSTDRWASAPVHRRQFFSLSDPLRQVKLKDDTITPPPRSTDTISPRAAQLTRPPRPAQLTRYHPAPLN